MQEIYKDILGYERIFQISNMSNVKSMNFNRTKKEKVMKLTKHNGYLIVNLTGKIFRVHRLIAIAFIPNPDNKPFINHIDCNTLNNDLNNLEWCTHGENQKHAFNVGRARFDGMNENWKKLKLKQFVECIKVRIIGRGRN
jgi:hypothetical protein